jgi:hypothetical protein
MDAVDALWLAMVTIVTHAALFMLGCRYASRSQPTPAPTPPPVNVHAHVYLWQPPQEVDEDDGEEWKLGDPLEN